MYAIVEIKGKQFRVEKNLELDIPKINDKVGSKIEFNKSLFINEDGKISTNKNLKVVAKVLSHETEKKVIVFKQKRRKGYQKKNGHKQPYTKILIQDLKSASKKTVKKSTSSKNIDTKAKKSTSKEK